MQTPESLRILLNNAVDYAGTFPPAQLSKNDALARYGKFRSEGNFPWLMGRLVLPLKEILNLSDEEIFKANRSGDCWNMTALGNASDLSGVKTEIKQIAEWNEHRFSNRNPLFISAYETKTQIRENLSSALSVYCEIDILDAKLSETIAALKKNKLAMKVRTGGDKKPTAEVLAKALFIAGQNQVQFKATQGLHEAATHGDDFGFLNLFAALSLAYSSKSREDLIAKTLLEANASLLHFSPELTHIHRGCFGSCSIDEPDESLKKFLGAKK